MKFIGYAHEYYCDCGAEPTIFTGNKVKYCPVCGGYKTLHKRRKVKRMELWNKKDKEDVMKGI